MVQLNSALASLITKSFSKSLEQNLPFEETILKLAKKDFQTITKIGDELNLVLPGEVHLSAYSGGDLNMPEFPGDTTIKIKVNKGKSVHFAIDDVKAIQLNALIDDGDKAAQLIKEYSKNATEKFTAAMETDAAALYTKAGYNYNVGFAGGVASTALNFTPSTFMTLFTGMKQLFTRGIQVDGVWRKCWTPGKMVAFIPPELTGIITPSTRFQYTDEGMDDSMKQGFIDVIAGWKVYETPFIAPINGNQYAPLFGVEGETLGAIVQKNMELIHYVPPLNFNDAFKGRGFYGVDVARVDKFGSALITVSQS